MRKMKAAVIGAGFMGKTHVEALRRLGTVEVAAVAGVSPEEAQSFAAAQGIPVAAPNYKAILADPEIDGVHICTPNATHSPIALEALKAGKHVLCEKPLAMSAAEAKQMVDLAAKKRLVNATNHNLRYYPMVQQVRRMIEAGELGEILTVQGAYSQDWLLYDTDFNWRIQRKANGPLRVMGDIGSHWMDTIQHVTGLAITELCADLAIIHKTRKQPKVAIETFAGRAPARRLQRSQDRPRGTSACACCIWASPAAAPSPSARWRRLQEPVRIHGMRSKSQSPGTRRNPNRSGWQPLRTKQTASEGSSMLGGPMHPAYADYPAATRRLSDAHKQLFQRFWPVWPTVPPRLITRPSPTACVACNCSKPSSNRTRSAPG